ncbi:MAG: hypothetical protein ACTSRK_15775 [Promethearchaeota archaeon]
MTNKRLREIQERWTWYEDVESPPFSKIDGCCYGQPRFAIKFM